MNELVLKVYDIDYSFIIKNYLSPELWKKEWTLFVYRDVVIYLTMSIIDVKDMTICFGIHIRCGQYTNYDCVWYHMNCDNLNVLKKQINGAMRNVIDNYETYCIKKEDGYREINSAEYEERETLTEIANNFLDSEGVSNSEIRDVYIDNYVDNNLKTSIHLSNYLNGRKYRNKTDLWLIFYKAIGNEEKFNEINTIVGSIYDYDDILEEIKIFKDKDSEEYQDYISEMEDNLESL